MSEKIVQNPKKINDYNFDPSLFIPMQSDLDIDKIYSNDVGLMPGTNYIVIGDPGIGKTTVVLKHIRNLQERNYKTVYINAEMTLIDMAVYTQRFPEFGDVDTYFVKQLLKDDIPIDEQLERIIQDDYHVVGIDSLAELLNIIKEEKRWTSTKAEKWLLDIIEESNTINYTSFLIIQQVNKNGTFKGSNKIKHNTTGMLEMRWDDNNETYMYFTKNRRGGVNQRMYFKLGNNDLKFDVDRFYNDVRASEELERQNDINQRSEINFDNYVEDNLENDLKEEVQNMSH